MGKKSQTVQDNEMPPYPKLRLAKIKLNAARMKAAALSELANKAVVSSSGTSSRRIVELETHSDSANEGSQYELDQEEYNEEETMDLGQNFLAKGKGSKTGKKSQSVQVSEMPPYAKQRLAKIKLNAARMKAAGLTELANQILATSCGTSSRGIVESETHSDSVNEGSDYELDQDECNEEEALDLGENFGSRRKTSKSDNRLSKKGEQQPSRQTLPMADFARLRSRKFQQVPSQQQQPKQPKNVTVRTRNADQHQQRPQQGDQNIGKQLPSQERSDKRKQNPNLQYVVPGQLEAYKKMRLRQQQMQQFRLTDEYPPSNISGDEANVGVLNLSPRQAVQVPHMRSSDNDEALGSNNSFLPEDVVDNQNVIEPDCDLDENQDNRQRDAIKKHRGPTLMAKVHRRTIDERQVIVLNEHGQPVGPSKEAVVEFTRFLGTVAKDPEFAPINILDWRFMPTKEEIWTYVKTKYIIPEEGKGFVMATVNNDWRVYKSRLKGFYMEKFDTNEERWDNRPSTIPDYQFREALDYWTSLVGKEIARINASNRQNHNDVHTMGPCSHAMLRYSLKQKDANKQPPSESLVYKESRKRDPKRVYKTDGSKTKENIDKMSAIQLQIENGETSIVDPFTEVITKERKRGIFLHGQGVTKSKLKGKGKKEGYIIEQDFFQNMKEEWAQQMAQTLASQIVSQIQAANPQLNLVVPDFACASTSENGEQSVDNDVEVQSPQDEDNEG